jgi:hypothetical protein
MYPLPETPVPVELTWCWKPPNEATGYLDPSWAEEGGGAGQQVAKCNAPIFEKNIIL